MKKIITDAHAEEHILYIGCVPDIERYFSAADLLVHCSFYEGGPLTVIEGLATTLPFLATRTGCLSTLPDEFSGCTIIPPQIPIEELTSPRLWERSAEFDAGLARRIVDYCKAGHHDRVVVSASLRKRFAREYAFESYLTLTRILASGRPVASFPEEQNQTWVDYVEKNESL
jgi:glycosyltransferase involved in cell wall biosynthesis